MPPAAAQSRFDRWMNTLFRIRKGEFFRTFLMFLYAFNAVAAFIIGRITKDSLFLAVPGGIDWLWATYGIVAIGVTSVTAIYYKHVGRSKLNRVITIWLTIITVCLVFFRYLLTQDWIWVVFTLYVFIEIMGILLVIQFWTFANELFTSREAKRLFGVIGGGTVLANLYSFPVKYLVNNNLVRIENLMLLIAFSVIVCIVIVNVLSSRYRVAAQQQQKRDIEKKTRPERSAGSSHLQVYHVLARYLLLIIAVTYLVVTAVDYQWKVMAKLSYGTKEDIANYFFNVYAYGGVLACFIQFFLTSRILDKFGILPALMMLPIAMFGGSVASLTMVGILGVTLTKGAEVVTRYTVHETTVNLLYQPLPPDMRRKTKAAADGMIRPIAAGIAGFLFYLLGRVWHITDGENVKLLAIPTAVLVVVWVALLVMARRKYVEALVIGGERRSRLLDDDEDDVNVFIDHRVLRKAIDSGEEIQILNALEVMPTSNMHDWADAIEKLCKHKSHKVRIESIRYLVKSGNRKFSRLITQMIEDENEEVVAEAIRGVCSLERERAVGNIAVHLSSDNPQIKAATIMGLIQYGGLDGILNSTAKLKQMLDNRQPKERENGARVLGYIKIKSFYQALFRLINDRDLRVRNAAIFAAGEMQAEELIPNLIYKLRDLDSRTEAVEALSSFGRSIVPKLDRVLQLLRCDENISQGIPPILGNVGGREAVVVLQNLLPSLDSRFRTAVVKSLQKITIREPDTPVDYFRVQEALKAELEEHYQFLEYKRVAQSHDGNELMISALDERLEDSMSRIFTLLTMVYPRRQIEIVQYNLKSDNPALRANSIEIIDNILDTEMKRYFIPLLDTISLEEKVAMGLEFFKLVQPSYEEFVVRLLERSNGWLLIATLYTIGLTQDDYYTGHLLHFLDHIDPVVRETAVQTLSKMMNRRELDAVLRRFPDETDNAVLEYRNYALMTQVV